MPSRVTSVSVLMAIGRRRTFMRLMLLQGNGVIAIAVLRQCSINWDTFLKVLTFAYTGTLEYGKLKELDLVQLLSASTKYEGLERLTWECERHLTSLLNT